MRWMILVVLVLVGCGDDSPTAPGPDDQPPTLDWPVREWRDTVVVFDPETGENR